MDYKLVNYIFDYNDEKNGLSTMNETSIGRLQKIRNDFILQFNPQIEVLFLTRIVLKILESIVQNVTKDKKNSTPATTVIFEDGICLL